MKTAGLFVLLFALWLGWSGLYKPLVIALGAVSSVLCVWIALRMHESAASRFSVTLVLRSLAYLPWLAKEIMISNWQVIRIVLSPRLPIRPVVLRVRGSQHTDLGRVIYGNSITLTPGTLTMDVDGDLLTVHALTHEGAEALEGGAMNTRVAALEGAR